MLTAICSRPNSKTICGRRDNAPCLVFVPWMPPTHNGVCIKCYLRDCTFGRRAWRAKCSNSVQLPFDSRGTLHHNLPSRRSTSVLTTSDSLHRIERWVYPDWLDRQILQQTDAVSANIDGWFMWRPCSDVVRKFLVRYTPNCDIPEYISRKWSQKMSNEFVWWQDGTLNCPPPCHFLQEEARGQGHMINT